MIAYSDLKNDLERALDSYFERLSEDIDISKLYSIGLYTSEEFGYLAPTANVTDYQGKNSSDLGESDFSNKWSAPDWIYHNKYSELFSRIDENLNRGWDEDFSIYEIDSARIISIVKEVLTQFRQSRLRDSKVLVGLFMSSPCNLLVRSIACEVNPPKVYHAYEADLQRLYRCNPAQYLIS